MIIDLILDRKDGEPYDPRRFYHDVRDYEDVFQFKNYITMAMDYGTEKEVKTALKRYLYAQEYPLQIGEYIDSVNWL